MRDTGPTETARSRACRPFPVSERLAQSPRLIRRGSARSSGGSLLKQNRHPSASTHAASRCDLPSGRPGARPRRLRQSGPRAQSAQHCVIEKDRFQNRRRYSFRNAASQNIPWVCPLSIRPSSSPARWKFAYDPCFPSGWDNMAARGERSVTERGLRPLDLLSSRYQRRFAALHDAKS
jgi:hypothetical protein